MAVLRFGGFQGEVPRIHPRLLPSGASQNCVDAKLDTGAIRPVRQASVVKATVLTDPVSLYRYSDSVWLESTEDVDWVPYPVAADAFGRLIFADPSAGALRVTDASLVGTGGYPSNYYQLDVPAPSQGFSATLVGTADDPDSQAETRFYVVTFVNSYGAEGPPSPPSNEIEWRFGQTVDLTSLPAVPPGNYNITHRRIYRINTGVSSSAYQFVSEVAVSSSPQNISGITTTNPVAVTCTGAHGFASGQEVTFASIVGTTELNGNSYFINVTGTDTFELAGVDGTGFTTYVSGGTVRQLAGTSYSDAVPSASLGEVLATTTYDPPNSATVGLVTHPSGFLAGFFGKTLCFSELGAPHAWPIDYRLTTAYDIVGLGVFGNNIAVMTKGLPYVATGSDPAAMTMVELEIDQACIAKRSIVDFGSAVVYASPDGLIQVSGNGVQNITSAIFTRSQWQALNPSSIVGFNWEGDYLGFYDDGSGTTRGFVVNPFAPDFGVRYVSAYATGGYKDLEEDVIYLIVEGDITGWDQGTTDYTYTWKSRPEFTPRPVNMSAARVLADTWPVQVSVYADGVLRDRRQVHGETAYRLPGGYRASKYEVVIRSTSQVVEFAMATTMQELSVLA